MPAPSSSLDRAWTGEPDPYADETAETPLPPDWSSQRERRFRWARSRLVRLFITAVVLLVASVTVGFGLLGVYRRWWDVPLTTGWVVLGCGVLLVAVVGLTGFSWDRPGRRGLRRSSLLLATQLVTALTLGSAVNLAGGFYGSLGELIGAGHGAGPMLGAQPSAKGHEPPAVEPWLATARKQTGPGRGVWTQLTISGRRTGYALPAWVYVPDAYFDKAAADQRFPVSVLLAGFPGTPENWERQGHLVPLLDKLMSEGRIPPMIFVAPSQNPDPKRDSECVDANKGAQADTYLTQDVPESISEHLRTTPDRTGWSLMGYSTGGYCAVNLALRHSDRFASSVCLDGYFAPAVDASTGDLFRGDEQTHRANTPQQTIRDHRSAGVRFYLTVGDAEPKLKKSAGDFAALVRPPDSIAVVDGPGGHNWTTWTNALPAALDWLAKAG